MEKMSHNIELIRDGDLRIALTGVCCSGKSTLAQALLGPRVVIPNGDSESLALADVIIHVHDIRSCGFSSDERVLLQDVVKFLNPQESGRLLFALTRSDTVGDECRNKGAQEFERQVSEMYGFKPEIYVVAAPLWNLSWQEETSGRNLAARCFRGASGMECLLRRIEHIRWIGG